MKRLIYVVLFLTSSAFAGSSPLYKTGNTPTDENFRDLYDKVSGISSSINNGTSITGSPNSVVILDANGSATTGPSYSTATQTLGSGIGSFGNYTLTPQVLPDLTASTDLLLHARNGGAVKVYSEATIPGSAGGDLMLWTSSGSTTGSIKLGAGVTTGATPWSGIGGYRVQIDTESVKILSPLKIADGTEGSGKILTSDTNGVATWQTFSLSDQFSSYSLVQATGTKNLGSAAPLTFSTTTDRVGEMGTSTFTATSAGFYEVSLSGYVGAFDSGTDSHANFYLMKGTTQLQHMQVDSATTGANAMDGTIPYTLHYIISASASDKIWVNATSSPNAYSTSYSLSIKRTP